MSDEKENEFKLNTENNEADEEIDDDRLIPSTPKISINKNEGLAAYKWKIIIIISCFLILVVGLAIALVFIFRPDETYEEEKKDEKDDEVINVKDNIIILNYEITELDKKIHLINSNFLQNISSMQIKNSDRTVNISLFPVDSYRFAEIDNYTVEIKFNNNLTNLNYIFQDCTSLTEVDFSQLNAFYAIEMEYVFDSCSSLKKVDFGDINTSLVISMKNMFSYCVLLNEVNLSFINTTNLEDISNMFLGCRSLPDINVTKFKTEKIKYMNNMFESCYSLESLDLGNFITPELIDISGLLKNCYKLKILI